MGKKLKFGPRKNNGKTRAEKVKSAKRREKICRKFQAEADAWDDQLLTTMHILRDYSARFAERFRTGWLDIRSIAYVLSKEELTASRMNVQKQASAEFSHVSSRTLRKLRREREQWALIGQRIRKLCNELHRLDDFEAFDYSNKMLKYCKITEGDVEEYELSGRIKK